MSLRVCVVPSVVESWLTLCSPEVSLLQVLGLQPMLPIVDSGLFIWGCRSFFFILIAIHVVAAAEDTILELLWQLNVTQCGYSLSEGADWGGFVRLQHRTAGGA